MSAAASTYATSHHWKAFLHRMEALASRPQPLEAQGVLERVAGLVLEASGLKVPLGTICHIAQDTGAPLSAEVVGFHGDRAYLMPTGPVQGLVSGAAVTPLPELLEPLSWTSCTRPAAPAGRGLRLPMGTGLLGRVVDAKGQPLDGHGPLDQVSPLPLSRQPINAMERDPVRQPLDTGVRAINAMLTVGRGQRIGLFAGTGVGKSVLLGMMARFTKADVIVVGLIGERGREVKEFIEDILGEEGRRRSVVVAAPADEPPLVRMQGAHYATAIAESFRDQGLDVLLLMDSLTRYAMAQREVALAIGEPPATRGYPPSCFAKLPALVERSGNGPAGGGSITAIYTVLSEGDDPQDPIADAARGILDGHIVLSRDLAESGHFPAIDVEASISRVMTNVVDKHQLNASRQLRQWLSKLSKARDLLQIGAYVPGHDPALDQAVQSQNQILALLQQGMHERSTLQDSQRALARLCPTPGA